VPPGFTFTFHVSPKRPLVAFTSRTGRQPLSVNTLPAWSRDHRLVFHKMDAPLAPQRSRNHQDGFQSPSGQISKAAFFRARPFSGQANNRTSFVDNDNGPSSVQASVQNVEESRSTSSIALAIASGAQNWPDTSRQAIQDSHLGTMSPPATQGHSPVTLHEHRAESIDYDKPLPADLSRIRSARNGVGDVRGEALHKASPRAEPSSLMNRSSSKASSRVGQVKRVDTLVRNSPESSNSHMSGESGDLLMSLMAGQAAMDNQNMPISSWEQVEEWKKVCPDHFPLQLQANMTQLCRNYPCSARDWKPR
jgi:hypothetical protein